MNLKLCPEWYPTTVFSEQDTNESYWHNLCHLLKSLVLQEWVYLAPLMLTEERWN